jgi:hypothetical protein
MLGMVELMRHSEVYCIFGHLLFISRYIIIGFVARSFDMYVSRHK